MSDFTLFFLAFPLPGEENNSAEDKKKGRASREAVLEYANSDLSPWRCSCMDRLTWNHGTEKDDSFQGYHNGNKEPKGCPVRQKIFYGAQCSS